MNGERGTLEMRRLLLRWRVADLSAQCLAGNQRGDEREILAGGADAAFHQRKRPWIAAGVALRLEEGGDVRRQGRPLVRVETLGICFSPRAP